MSKKVKQTMCLLVFVLTALLVPFSVGAELKGDGPSDKGPDPEEIEIIRMLDMLENYDVVRSLDMYLNMDSSNKINDINDRSADDAGGKEEGK